MIRATALLLSIMAALVLYAVLSYFPVTIMRADEEPEDVYIALLVASAAALTSLFFGVVAGRHPRSPWWVSFTLVGLAIPVFFLGGLLCMVAISDLGDWFLLIPAGACILASLAVLLREYPRVSVVPDEMARGSRPERHDAI